MTKSRFTLLMFTICVCTLVARVAQGQSSEAIEQSRINNIRSVESRRELFELAVESLDEENYSDATIYLAAHLALFPNSQEEDVAKALNSSIFHVATKSHFEWYNVCLSGCSQDDVVAAGLNVTFGAEIPVLTFDDSNSVEYSLLCRGGDMRFVQSASTQGWDLFSQFETRPLLMASEDDASTFQPGECGLITRVSSLSFSSRMVFPSHLFGDGIAVEWDEDHEIRAVGASRSLAPPQSIGFGDTAVLDNAPDMVSAAPGTSGVRRVSAYEALENLRSGDRYQMFEVYVDQNSNLAVAEIGEAGDWSRFELQEMSFQNGREPFNNYSGMEDVTLSQNDPQLRLGGRSICFVDGDDPNDSDDDKLTLLRWDIDAIPPGSTVESVRLTLNVTDASTNSYGLYEVRRDWHEGRATWNHATTADRWTSSGLGSIQDRGTRVLGYIRATSIGSAEFELNSSGRAVVQKWIDDSKLNHGFLLRNTYAGDGLDFSCSETSVGLNRPMLTITYKNE